MLELKEQITECLGPKANAWMGSEGPPEEHKQSSFRTTNIYIYPYIYPDSFFFAGIAITILFLYLCVGAVSMHTCAETSPFGLPD